MFSLSLETNTKSQANVSNCFGFDDDEEDD